MCYNVKNKRITEKDKNLGDNGMEQEKPKKPYQKRLEAQLEKGICRITIAFPCKMLKNIERFATAMSMSTTKIMQYMLGQGLDICHHDSQTLEIKKMKRRSKVCEEKMDMTDDLAERKSIYITQNIYNEILELQEKLNGERNEECNGEKYTISDIVVATIDKAYDTLISEETMELIWTEKELDNKTIANRINWSIPIIIERHLERKATELNISVGDYLKILLWKDYKDFYSPEEYLYVDKSRTKECYYYVQKIETLKDKKIYFICNLKKASQNKACIERYTEEELMDNLNVFYRNGLAGAVIKKTKKKKEKTPNNKNTLLGKYYEYQYTLESICVYPRDKRSKYEPIYREKVAK